MVSYWVLKWFGKVLSLKKIAAFQVCHVLELENPFLIWSEPCQCLTVNYFGLHWVTLRPAVGCIWSEAYEWLCHFCGKIFLWEVGFQNSLLLVSSDTLCTCYLLPPDFTPYPCTQPWIVCVLTPHASTLLAFTSVLIASWGKAAICLADKIYLHFNYTDIRAS